jgi:hypothetical protein
MRASSDAVCIESLTSSLSRNSLLHAAGVLRSPRDFVSAHGLTLRAHACRWPSPRVRSAATTDQSRRPSADSSSPRRGIGASRQNAACRVHKACDSRLNAAHLSARRAPRGEWMLTPSGSCGARGKSACRAKDADMACAKTDVPRANADVPRASPTCRVQWPMCRVRTRMCRDQRPRCR